MDNLEFAATDRAVVDLYASAARIHTQILTTESTPQARAEARELRNAYRDFARSSALEQTELSIATTNVRAMQDAARANW